MAQGINIGVDEQGRDFLVYGNSVYRIDDYSPGGTPFGKWFCNLDFFLGSFAQIASDRGMFTSDPKGLNVVAFGGV